MQTIPSTFAAYAGPFRSRGILDPLANIYAGVNYAIARYGPSWRNVLGHGHGYWGGGLITEPIAGFGLRSGTRYSFGEKGPERVTPGAGGAHIGGPRRAGRRPQRRLPQGADPGHVPQPRRRVPMTTEQARG
jgi:SLT domain-containing protein